MEKKIEYIKRMFKDLNPHEAGKNYYFKMTNLSTGNYSPPDYIVSVLFLSVLGCKNYGSMEKVLWHTYFEYKNCIFMISDYKFGSWSIEGFEKKDEIMVLVEEIKRKIKKASRALDVVLYEILQKEFKKENYYLNNVYHKLMSIYGFYEEKILSVEKKYKELNKKGKSKSVENWVKMTNEVLDYEREISNYTFSLILIFFSILEFLLDVIYAFEKPAIKFNDFRKMFWQERFKLLFDVSNRKINYFYNKFIGIKEKYRNPLSHGLTGEINVLVPLPFHGLVPLSYEYLSNKIHYGFGCIPMNEVMEIIKCFRDFYSFLSEEEPYSFYILYVDAGFPIPMNEKEIAKLNGLMIGYEEFKDYLIDRSRYEDALMNRDIMP